jgi:hypothetical protein
MSTQKNDSATFAIKTILVNSANSSKYCDEIIRTMGLKNNSKKRILDIQRKLNSVESDIRLMVSPEYAEIIRKEISDNWETLSVHNIQVMMMAMNDAQRQVLESAACHILDGTFRIETEKQ